MKRPCGVMCAGPGSAFPQTPEGALTRTASPGPRVIQLEIHKKKRSETPPPRVGKLSPATRDAEGKSKRTPESILIWKAIKMGPVNAYGRWKIVYGTCSWKLFYEKEKRFLELGDLRSHLRK